MIYTPGAIYRESPPYREESIPCMECGKPMTSLIRYQMPVQWRCIQKGCYLSIFKVVKVPSFSEELNEAISRFQA
jgi:hypothetical protein